MNINDKTNFPLKGILKISIVDAKTGEVLDEFEEENVVVLDARETITHAISAPTSAYTVSKIKIGEDFGQYMSGSPNVTFADADPDTIVRDAGSFLTDGFNDADSLTISDSVSNDGEYTIDTVTATTITLDSGDTLVAEGPSPNIAVSTGTIDVPLTALNTYDETYMQIIQDASYVLGVGYPDSQSVNFAVTIVGQDVIDLWAPETSKRINSAALHSGNGKVFVYKRFSAKSISALVNIVISWSITY